jgi:hypothetical protein
MEEILIKHWGKMIPQEPVAPRDVWERTITLDSMPMVGGAELRCAAGLVDIKESPEGQIAVITIAIETDLSSTPMDMTSMGGGQGDASFEDFHLRITGTAHFNIDVGLATHLTMTMTGDGRMSVRPPGGRPQTAGMDMTVEYASDLTPR